MSAQFMVTYNETSHHFQMLQESSQGGKAGGVVSGNFSTGDSAESSVKQREALYYIVAVISFYALTFLILFIKYAKFKKRELDEVVPYYPLPPDATNMSTYTKNKDELFGVASSPKHSAQGARDQTGRGRSGSSASSHPAEKGDLLALRKYGSRDSNYGSNDVTPKVMRVKMVPRWLCRKEETTACDV